MMDVIKRDGSKEAVSFDKVLQRITLKSDGLDVNPHEIAQKVCGRIYNGVETSKLDELTAQLCSSLIVVHPDYGILATRISISNHHKNTSPSFSESVSIMYESSLVSENFYKIVMENKDKLNSTIDYSRDYDFSFFGFKTLEKAYLTRVNDKIVERPQQLIMRVAIFIHENDIRDAIDTYDRISRFEFIHATPTMFNAGTNRPQASSCFLGEVPDSIQGIYECLTDCANISKYAGGIGLHIHGVRGRNSIIKGTNGKSTGIVPMLRVFNTTARYVNQSGRRNGSIAVYLEPWHTDIMEFLEMKKNHGVEEERARDLFYAMWIPDLFMERVMNNDKWCLMCPDACRDLPDKYGDEFKELYEKYEREGKYIKQINAQDVWKKIIESQIETGTPYMLYKDAINKKSNQKNIGTIKSSNLCVSGNTKILTDMGYFNIIDKVGMQVNVWNGCEFSNVFVLKTGEKQKMMRVTFSNGQSIVCTPYHKFYIDNEGQEGEVGTEIEYRAIELQIGMKLIDYCIPVTCPPSINIITKYEKNLQYTSGFYAALNNNNRLEKNIMMSRYGEHINKILDNLCVINNNTDVSGYMYLTFCNISKYTKVPDECLQYCKNWLNGFVDGNGIQHSDTNYMILYIDLDSAKDLYYMLQSLGISSSHNMNDVLRNDSNSWMNMVQFKVSSEELKRLGDCDSPFIVNTLPLEKNIYVRSLEDIDELMSTYCFNEPLKNRGVFNGIIAGNCTEIMEYTDPDEIAVCNLASICLPTFVKNKTYDFKRLHDVTKVVTKNLNKVIDNNFYPVEKAKRSNFRHRPIGIGVQGLADAFILMRYAFDSKEAKELNKLIFETIYHGALEASMEISKKRFEIINSINGDEYDLHINEFESKTSEYPGAYSSFKDSPASQGILQFDMWNVTPSDRYDWELLKTDIKKYGLRNSLLLAPMPTASTSQIMGFNEAFEAFTSNIYKRKTIAGEFILINNYLVKDLIALELWDNDMKEKILINDGSIQNIDSIPKDLKELYKTVWEISQKDVIDMAADRGAFICQSQSMNLFMSSPDYKKLTSMHFYAWKKGLKTGQYYLRSQPKANAQKFSINPEKEEDCVMCSA